MARPLEIKNMLPSLWRVLRKFWPYIREYRLLITGSLAALFIEIGFRVLEPWPLKFVFDRVIAHPLKNGKSRFPAFDSIDSSTLLILAAVGIVAFAGFRALAAYANKIGFALVGNRVLSKVRSELYKHLQFLSLSFHNKAKNGDLIVRVIGDVGLLKDVTVTAILPLLANTLILFAMMGIMLWLNWQLTMVVLAVFPLFLLFGSRMSFKIRQVSKLQRRRQSAMATTVAESFGAIKIVQALSLEDVFDQSFSSQNNKSLKEGVQAKRLSANLERTVDILIALATALVVYFGSRLVMRSALTPGDLLVFLSYLKSAFKPVRNFAKYTARLAKASAAGDRVMDILETVPDICDLPDAVPAPSLHGHVKYEDVHFAYEPGQNVLSGISFEARPGQQIALVGPSGTGKSTLVSLVMRLYEPSAGRVLIDGKDIRGFTLGSLRSQISMVLQDPMLFGASIYKNIAYGAPEVTRAEVEAAARLANAHEFITALPEGYETELGERGVTLSNGQRQRIAIARAAVRKSPILILDEPTTGLDKENEHEVVEALERLAYGRTTFMIVHDLKLAVIADHILFLENGKICEQGNHDELMAKKGRYAAMWRLQSAHRDKRINLEDTYVISA